MRSLREKAACAALAAAAVLACAPSALASSAAQLPGILSSGILSSGLASVPAASVPSTVSDFAALPGIAAWDAYAAGLTSGPFHAYGKASHADGTVYSYETFLGNGSVVRNSWGRTRNDSGHQVLMSDGSVTCARKAAPPSASRVSSARADRSASWECGVGRDQGSAFEFGMLIPGQAARQWSVTMPNMTFSYEGTDPSAPGAAINVRAFSNDSLVWVARYSRSGDGYRYDYADEFRQVGYAISAGLDGQRLVPLDKLRKTWGWLTGLVSG